VVSSIAMSSDEDYVSSQHGFEEVGIWKPCSSDSGSLRQLRDQLDETKRELNRMLEERTANVQALTDLRALLERQVAQSKQATESMNRLSEKMEEQQQEVRRLRLENAQLKMLANNSQLSGLEAVREVERLREELDHAEKIASLKDAASVAMKPSGGFKPRVAVYDIVDDLKGLRRIVRVEAPGRCLSDDGAATVTGAVRSLDNGVRISLVKSPDIPSDAVFEVPHVVEDPVGSWDWDYKPKDGVWKLSESWGFSHGIFAVALERKSASKTKARSSPSPQKSIKSARSLTPMRRKRASAVQAGLPMEEGRSLVAVIAPTSTQNPLFSYFREDTLFVTADGNHIDGDDLDEGTLLLGPEGTFTVMQILRGIDKDREVLSVLMEHEGVCIVKGTRVSSVVVTVDGAATADWDYYDVSELKARSHELGLRVPSGAEATVPILSVALSTHRAPIFAMQLESNSGDRAVFVVTQRNLSGYMRRPKRAPQSPPKSSRTPFAPPVHQRTPKGGCGV